MGLYHCHGADMDFAMKKRSCLIRSGSSKQERQKKTNIKYIVAQNVNYITIIFRITRVTTYRQRLSWLLRIFRITSAIMPMEATLAGISEGITRTVKVSWLARASFGLIIISI